VLAPLPRMLIDGLLEALFPTRCAGCDLPGGLLCARCREALPRIDPATACPLCFAPYGWLVCTECWDTDLGIDGAVAVGLLDRPLSRCVTLFKDSSEKRLAEQLGGLLADAAIGRWGDRVPSRPHPIADAIVPVPASAEAVRRRGYDHMSLIAQSVAQDTGIPCLHLLSHAGAVDQRALSREERMANVAGVFEVRAEASCPDRVLVVDDVMTTGATMRAAALSVREAGALEVRAGCVARAW